MKNNWMLFLIGFSFGISSLSILLLTNGCNEGIDYSVKAKWIYINETDYSITFLPENSWSEFDISANDTTVYLQNSEGPKNVEAESYVPPINTQAVVIDGLRCDSTLAENLRKISSYEQNKIGTRNFEFIFRFTQDNTSGAIECK